MDTYLDWGEVTHDQSHEGIAVGNITVPFSCCAQTRTQFVNEMEVEECEKLYANGCLPRITYLVYQSAGLLGAGAMTIAFIQVKFPARWQVVRWLKINFFGLLLQKVHARTLPSPRKFQNTYHKLFNHKLINKAYQYN